MKFNAGVRPETINSPPCLTHLFRRVKQGDSGQKIDCEKNETTMLESLYGMEFIATYILYDYDAYIKDKARVQAVLFRFEACDVLLEINQRSGCLEIRSEVVDLRTICYSVPSSRGCYYWQLDSSSLYLAGSTLISFKFKPDPSSNDAQRAKFNLGNGRIIFEANHLYIIDT